MKMIKINARLKNKKKWINHWFRKSRETITKYRKCYHNLTILEVCCVHYLKVLRCRWRRVNWLIWQLNCPSTINLDVKTAKKPQPSITHKTHQPKSAQLVMLWQNKLKATPQTVTTIKTKMIFKIKTTNSNFLKFKN